MFWCEPTLGFFFVETFLVLSFKEDKGHFTLSQKGQNQMMEVSVLVEVISIFLFSWLLLNLYTKQK